MVASRQQKLRTYIKAPAGESRLEYGEKQNGAAASTYVHGTHFLYLECTKVEKETYNLKWSSINILRKYRESSDVHIHLEQSLL